jgi:hypothetical protein
MFENFSGLSTISVPQDQAPIFMRPAPSWFNGAPAAAGTSTPSRISADARIVAIELFLQRPDCIKRVPDL